MVPKTLIHLPTCTDTSIVYDAIGLAFFSTPLPVVVPRGFPVPAHRVSDDVSQRTLFPPTYLP